ncbi:hypothetical protein MASR2M47_18230 [Draconibacterium sp.]
MKKAFFFILFGLALSSATFAGLKSKQIVGGWEYEITISNTQVGGSFVFAQNDNELTGKSIQPDGSVSGLSNIKINNKNETLCFQLIRENDVPIEFILTVDRNKFKGKGWINDASFEITGDKITIQ